MIYLIIPIVLFFILSGLAFVSFKFASAHRSDEDFEPARRGCLLTLASLLLRPVPVIFAFYQFGFMAAVAVALAIWVILRCFDFFKGKTWSRVDLLVVPLGAGLTMFTGNVMYFQLVPSAWCVRIVLGQLVALIQKRANLFPEDGTETIFSKDETRLARWGIMGAGLIALCISEYIRHNVSLSYWIWYYGYLRLELLPIILGSMAPAMIKMMRRSESEPN